MEQIEHDALESKRKVYIRRKQKLKIFIGTCKLRSKSQYCLMNQSSGKLFPLLKRAYTDNTNDDTRKLI